MFVLQVEKTVCLLCHEAVSVVKEYNLRRHLTPNTKLNMPSLASKKNSRLSKH